MLINLFYRPKRQYDQSSVNGHNLEVLLKNFNNLFKLVFKEKLNICVSEYIYMHFLTHENIVKTKKNILL